MDAVLSEVDAVKSNAGVGANVTIDAPEAADESHTAANKAGVFAQQPPTNVEPLHAAIRDAAMTTTWSWFNIRHVLENNLGGHYEFETSDSSRGK